MYVCIEIEILCSLHELLRPSYTRQHCCWKLLLATMFPRYFASKFVAKLPAVVTFGIMNNNDLT